MYVFLQIYVCVFFSANTTISLLPVLLLVQISSLYSSKLCMSIYICVCVCVCMCMYIYIYKEREEERDSGIETER